MKTIPAVIFVALLSCSIALGQSEVDGLRQAAEQLKAQRQRQQQQLNRDVEELNHRIQAYNSALAARRTPYELERLKRDSDVAQQKARLDQQSLGETTTNLQHVVQRLHEAQQRENQKRNEEAERAKRKYEEDVRREQQAQTERQRRLGQEQQARRAAIPRINFPGSGWFTVGPNAGDSGEAIVDFGLWKSTGGRGSMVNPYGLRFEVKLPDGNWLVEINTPGVSYSKNSGQGVVAWNTDTAHINVTHGQYTGSQATVRLTRANQGHGIGEVGVLCYPR